MALSLAAVLAVCADPPVKTSITADDVIAHLNRTIAWYEHVRSVDQSTSVPQNVLLQENVQQPARQVVKTAFAFAQAEAALLQKSKQPGAPAGNTTGQAKSLEQIAASATARIDRLQAQIESLNQQMAKARGRTLKSMQSQHDALAADLVLAKDIQGSIKTMLTFAAGSDTAGGLLGQINVLAHSAPVAFALNDAASPPAPAQRAATTAAPSPFHPESASILALVENTITLVNARSQIDSAVSDTDRLIAGVTGLLAPLRTSLRSVVSQSDTLATTISDQTSVDDLEKIRQQIAAFASRFTALAGPVQPLNEQNIVLETTKNELQQWRDATNNQLKSVLSYLAFRLGSLAIGIIILLIISDALRRLTFRYVRDARRRRQFIVLRRFGIGSAITLLLLLTFFSGFGSFATIAGFVTAGLAVALQNVILSVVAYFFLIGRYGLRPGDRVTVSGMTGEVIEVGLVRLYLMEMSGTGLDLHTTGRVAVFSNSVIFQPSALIKQAPGTAYTWHILTVTLASEGELDAARKRVLAAVESVFAGYRREIEQQQGSFERSMNIPLSPPLPTARARFRDGGIEVVVRYPVPFAKMVDTDEKMTQAVVNEMEKEPELHLAPNGLPKIEAAVA